MLHNNSAAAGRHAHLAHAALVGLHTLCCGAPALALLLTALSGAATGVALFAETAERAHALLHAHELWILAVSAALVVLGGALEIAQRARGGVHAPPWLYFVSVGCFVLNLWLVLPHRGG